MSTTEGYVDIYLLPVPTGSLDAYEQQATAFGQVAKEHGALSYREFLGDDLAEGFEAAEGQTLTAAVVEFRSRAHRDEVMEKVMADPRVKEQTDQPEITDMKQMKYGGFQTFVNP